MFVNPSSAFVGKPSVVASSSGSAKNARYARLFPSTRNSSELRAGASSRSSSRPVKVFGDIAPSLFALVLRARVRRRLDLVLRLLPDRVLRRRDRLRAGRRACQRDCHECDEHFDEGSAATGG